MTDGVEVVDAGPRAVSRAVVVDAPAAELFDQLADPRRHTEVDGSGTVRQAVSGPIRLGPGAKFSVNMRMLGAPYRITSEVVRFEENRVIEWRHPLRHTWRWEFEEIAPGRTRVTETWDYSANPAARFFGFVKANERGITQTLTGLRDRYSTG